MIEIRSSPISERGYLLWMVFIPSNFYFQGAREQKVCHSATVKEYSRSSADQVIISPLSVYLNRALLTCHHLATVLSVPVPGNPRVLNRLIIKFWIHFMQRINLSSRPPFFSPPRNYHYLPTFDPLLSWTWRWTTWWIISWTRIWRRKVSRGGSGITSCGIGLGA